MCVGLRLVTSLIPSTLIGLNLLLPIAGSAISESKVPKMFDSVAICTCATGDGPSSTLNFFYHSRPSYLGALR